jgi:hypothetical protein
MESSVCGLTVNKCTLVLCVDMVMVVVDEEEEQVEEKEEEVGEKKQHPVKEDLPGPPALAAASCTRPGLC